MNVVVAVDKFKGSLTSFEASSVIKSAILNVKPKYKVSTFPMADGGDGFGKVLKFYLKTKTVKVKTVDPIYRKIQGYYEWEGKSKTAIIELAVASGIVLLKKQELNPLLTSTFGTGILINHAIKKGAKRIILGLGGSATNDGGMGIAAALGFQFKDEMGNTLAPCGSALSRVRTIEKPSKRIAVSISIACDVNNPLFGKNGAAYIYAPQKGANSEQVKVLDKGLMNLSKIIEKDTSKNISKIPGAGAAGGVPALLNGYFNCTMMNGIDLVIKYSNIKKQLKKTNLLITGEGKIDNQSISGKVVGSLVEISNKNMVPVLLIAGISEISKKSPLIKHPHIQLLDSDNNLFNAIKHAKKILFKKTKGHFLNLV
jgi:glycerate kinase